MTTRVQEDIKTLVCKIKPVKQNCNIYVPVTVHREQSVKREYQQDATIQMFIFNLRCLILTTVSTCFGPPLCPSSGEQRPRITANGVCAGSAGCGW